MSALDCVNPIHTHTYTHTYIHTHTHTGTPLIVDETALSPGRLNEVGVANLTALGNVLQWQKVNYDFHYHTAEFECDLVSLATAAIREGLGARLVAM